MISETVTINVELPDSCSGYRAVGYRNPCSDEWYVNQGKPVQCICNHEYPKMILEPVEKWRPVDLEDLFKCITQGPIPCRVVSLVKPVHGLLLGVRRVKAGGLYFVEIDGQPQWCSDVEVLDK